MQFPNEIKTFLYTQMVGDDDTFFSKANASLNTLCNALLRCLTFNAFPTINEELTPD